MEGSTACGFVGARGDSCMPLSFQWPAACAAAMREVSRACLAGPARRNAFLEVHQQCKSQR